MLKVKEAAHFLRGSRSAIKRTFIKITLVAFFGLQAHPQEKIEVFEKEEVYVADGEVIRLTQSHEATMLIKRAAEGETEANVSEVGLTRSVKNLRPLRKGVILVDLLGEPADREQALGALRSDERVQWVYPVYRTGNGKRITSFTCCNCRCNKANTH
jgi:hypothetical protein